MEEKTRVAEKYDLTGWSSSKHLILESLNESTNNQVWL